MVMVIGQMRMVKEETGTGLFQYFVRVIPTTYKGTDGKFFCPLSHPLYCWLTNHDRLLPLPD